MTSEAPSRSTGCKACKRVDENFDNLKDQLDLIRFHMENSGNTIAALTRQASAVADNQKWMSETVQKAIQNLPNLISQNLPGGGMLAKMMGQKG